MRGIQQRDSSTSKKEIIVFLDSHRKYKNGCRDLFIDFRTLDDYQVFQKVLESNLSNSMPSYIHLKSVKIKQRLEFDTYYHLNVNELKRLKESDELVFNLEEDSYVIGGHYIFDKEAEYNDILEKCSPQELEEFQVEEFNNNGLSFISQNSLVAQQIEDPVIYVADVGQANWNELRDGDTTVLVFDCGSPLNSKKNVTDVIWNKHQQRLKKRPSTLVISHWDIDHYHCLIDRSVQDLKSCFKSVFCPHAVSNTSLKVYGSLKRIFDDVFVEVPSFVQDFKHLTWPPMKFQMRSHNVALYKGTSGNSINHSGLAIFIEGNNKTAIFSGDLRIGQCHEVRKQENISKPHVLIVPHHGGFCGKTSLTIHYPIDTAIISVGINNSYGHPNKDVIDYLKVISNNTIKRTDILGRDIEEKLS